MIYNRQTKEEVIQVYHNEQQWKSQFPFPSYRIWQIISYKSFRLFVIGFCGKIYPVIEYSKVDGKHIYYYKIEEFDKFVDSNFKSAEVESYYAIKYNNNHKWPWESRRRKILEFFSLCEQEKNKYIRFFGDHRCPALVAMERYREKAIIYNPCLKNYEFYKVFDAYQAYQEIAMFLGNLAEPERDIPVISNDDLVQAKGFDLKSSFRRPKSNKHNL